MWQHLESIGEALSEVFTFPGYKTSRTSARRHAVKDKHSGNGHYRSLGVIHGHSSMQGWRDRMEDASVTVQLRNGAPRGGMDMYAGQWDHPALFGVFDGHGGAQVANFCARHLPTQMGAARARGRSVSEALHESFHGLERLLRDPNYSDELQSFASKGSFETSRQPAHACGCTAAACCVLRSGEVVVANAGDCRVVLSRQGHAMDLTQDHKPDLPAEYARIVSAGGRLVEREHGNRKMLRINGGLNVSRTIGDFKYKQNENLPPNGQMVSCTPEIMSFHRTPQDEFLLIACDGVWDVLSSQQVVDFVRQHLPALRSGSKKPSEVAEEVLDICVSPNLTWTDGLGGDNMTLMIVVFAEQVNLVHTAPGYLLPRTSLGQASPRTSFTQKSSL